MMPISDEQLIMPVCSIFRRYIRRRGLKFTPERARILDVVLSQEGVFEPDDLYEQMRKVGHRVSKPTIYRALKHLVDAKIVTEVLIDSRQSHYQLIFGREPKAHLVCMDNGKITEFPAHQLTELAQQVCLDNGLDYAGHQLVVYGVDPDADKS